MTASDRPTVQVAGQTLGGGQPFLVAGPCVLESRDLALEIAETVAAIAAELGVPYVFKASFDKANRTSLGSARGPGIEDGLALLADIKQTTGLPVLTDVHLPDQCGPVSEVADILQVPAFLCRQTDLLLAASETGRPVNVKKGQFLAPWDMVHVVEKCRSAGASGVFVTERGTTFGFGRLVVDMAGLADLAASGAPVIFDATHSAQRPGSDGGTTGGSRESVPALARAAMATGSVDGLFFEVHPDPDKSPSDGPNMVRLEDFGAVLTRVVAIHGAAKGD